MNEQTQFDCIIMGGGLAGSLLFFGLKSKNPKSKVLLIEKNSFIGGNHTWCFHESDISQSPHHWVRELISKSWDGYDVYFPKFSRSINSPYHAIKSSELHFKLMQHYADEILLDMEVVTYDKESVTLRNGLCLKAICVVDARGWPQVSSPVGYQKFVGLDLKLKKNHDIKKVLLKDARVEQIDGYRFIYILPWSDDELLIEDTYYSNSSTLDVGETKDRILFYAQSIGLEVQDILRIESGCLPLVDSFYPKDGDCLRLGASSLEYQPVTGYSFPQTFERVQALLKLGSFNHEDWRKVLLKSAKKDRGQRIYFHLLNRMLFLAADSHSRYRILERFYKMPLPLIERFYSGKLTGADQLRILIGRPPVPVLRAIKSLFGR